jgi:hypothetical protein
MAPPRDNVSLGAVSKVALDALYVSVGLGVIAFQKAQVARKELTKAVEDQVKDVERRLRSVFPG